MNETVNQFIIILINAEKLYILVVVLRGDEKKEKNSQKTLRDLRPIHNISHLRHFVLYSKDATILETPTIRQSLMNKHLVTVEGKTLLIGRNLSQTSAVTSLG